MFSPTCIKTTDRADNWTDRSANPTYHHTLLQATVWLFGYRCSPTCLKEVLVFLQHIDCEAMIQHMACLCGVARSVRITKAGTDDRAGNGKVSSRSLQLLVLTKHHPTFNILWEAAFSASASCGMNMKSSARPFPLFNYFHRTDSTPLLLRGIR
jgi:hypothetical protein